MTSLPVREMVLYKHGVGYFVRGGEVSGERLALTFRADEVNDILKSLSVFDRAEDGQVLGVHYQTPMDRAHRLASSSVNLSVNGTLTDLVRDLRGRRVTMTFETTPGTPETVKGRVVGLEYMRSPEIMEQHITLLSDDGTLRVFPMYNVRDFTVDDDQSAGDLTYFLDTAMTEDDRRVIEVRLNDTAHDLVVSYVAPSPTWRVSYRLIAEAADDPDKGTALLQGWGLFDNRLEEDLENVQVTLVAGQPISFIYDLYASEIPERKTIKDEARTSGPVEYDSGVSWLSELRADEDPLMERLAAFEMRDTPLSLEDVEMSMPFNDRVRGSVKSAATGKATGETFQYIVTTPVTVKRGESAMVPIISADVGYERELLYNGEKLPSHPVAALRFTNTTGLTLERGPVTVVEDGNYRGEAILPFTVADNDMYLPYAVELGVTVRKDESYHEVHERFEVADAALVNVGYDIGSMKYTIHNATDKPRTVTIEVDVPERADGDFELYNTREPDVVTLHAWRWRVPVDAGGMTTFMVSVRVPKSSRYTLRNLSVYQMKTLSEQGDLRGDLLDRLGGLWMLLEKIAATKKAVKTLGEERTEIYGKQEQLRANLGALNPTGKEAALRDRILGQLEASQDRLEAIDAENAEAEATITATEAEIDALIAELEKTYGPEGGTDGGS